MYVAILFSRVQVKIIMFDTRIPFYGIMILLALLANIIVVISLYKKFKFSRDEIIGALVYENIGIIFGAKLLTFLQDYQQYGKFDFLSLGLSSYGGVIGAIVCLAIFGLQFKKNIKDILLTFMPPIPIMYAIGKIGCFLAGCCHGIKYRGLGNIVYNYSPVAPAQIPVFPVQLVETIFFTCIFIYIINRIIKDKFDLKVLGINFVLCGIGKFFLDYLRMSHTTVLLSLNQIISIIFIIIGIIMIIKKKKTK